MERCAARTAGPAHARDVSGSRYGKSMSELNPFAGAILPSAQAQRQQGAERAGNVRRVQEKVKNVAHQPGDVFEHQVESSDAVSAVHDQDRHDDTPKRRAKRQAPQDDAPDDHDPARLDVTA
jgi:hypothetical protein